MISLTVDIEQFDPADGRGRYIRVLEPLLQRLDEWKSRATFFVVGELVSQSAPLLRLLHQNGHEIALHGYTHRFLRDLHHDEFEREVAQGRDAIEQLVQTPVVGFRAPYFSLTKETPWAPLVLAASGFAYSSSVLPARNPQAGFRNAPREPFFWPSGVVEFPAPTFGLGSYRLPLIGGAYVRLAPSFLISLAKRSASKSPAPWTYCHPYDFDSEEKFHKRDGDGWLFSKLLFARREIMLERISYLVGEGSPCLRDLALSEHFRKTLNVWNP